MKCFFKNIAFHAIFEVFQAFKAALNNIEPDQVDIKSYYKVEGSDCNPIKLKNLLIIILISNSLK
jgi:hypothetical protein